MGATGTQKAYPKLQAQLTRPGQKTIAHEFLWVPECPDPLLGTDLLHKLKIQLSFQADVPTVTLGKQENIPIKILALFPEGENHFLLKEEHTQEPNNKLLLNWQAKIPEV